MTARNKKRKCKNTMLKNGGEKGKFSNLRDIVCTIKRKESQERKSARILIKRG